MSPAPGYRSFLLRFWQADHLHWRATLEDPHTGERRAFADVERLTEFLRGAVGRDFAPPPPSDRTQGGLDAD